MWTPELTQIVRLGLPGVHELGLELELSEEDLALWKNKRKIKWLFKSFLLIPQTNIWFYSHFFFYLKHEMTQIKCPILYLFAHLRLDSDGFALLISIYQSPAYYIQPSVLGLLQKQWAKFTPGISTCHLSGGNKNTTVWEGVTYFWLGITCKRYLCPLWHHYHHQNGQFPYSRTYLLKKNKKQ